MVRINERALYELMASPSGDAADYAHSVVLDFQRSEVLRDLDIESTPFLLTGFKPLLCD